MTMPERSANGGIINAQEVAVNHKLKKSTHCSYISRETGTLES